MITFFTVYTECTIQSRRISRPYTDRSVEPVGSVWGEQHLDGGEALDGEEDVEVGQAVRHTAQPGPQVHRVQLSYGIISNVCVQEKLKVVTNEK